MENQTLLSACLALTAAAVALQAGILVALYLAVRKSSARMEALATEVKTKLLPTAETVHSMLTDLRPKIETLLTNASETSGIVRGQLERLDATVNDVLDRARLQVIRADEFLNRTMDRVEEATEAVHKTVVSPVRQVSGLFRGLSVGVEAYQLESKRFWVGADADATKDQFNKTRCSSRKQRIKRQRVRALPLFFGLIFPPGRLLGPQDQLGPAVQVNVAAAGGDHRRLRRVLERQPLYSNNALARRT